MGRYVENLRSNGGPISKPASQKRWTRYLMCMQRHRRTWFILTIAVVAFTYNVCVAWSEATRPDLLAAVYLGLSAFVGSYSALDGQAHQPTPWMAIGLIVALLITFGTATSLLLQLSRSGIIRWAMHRRLGGVVVIGSSAEADAIARSMDTDTRRTLIRIREDGSADEFGSIGVPNWHRIGDHALTQRIVKTASAVVVAGSSDTASARISTALRPAMNGKRAFQLVRSPQLARALRPDILTSLPESEAFHPADNVGQLVAEVLSAHRRTRDRRTRVDFEPRGDDPTIESVRFWLENASAASSFVEDELIHEASVSIGEPADVCVMVGTPDLVAAGAAEQCTGKGVIAVVSSDLLSSVALPKDASIYSVSSWMQAPVALGPGVIVAVDPERDGLAFEVVADGLEAQWGRAFHSAYASLYASTDPTRDAAPWAVGRQGRDEQSSIAAAKFMLTVLRSSGYELKRGATGWIDCVPAPDVIDAMARMEHQEWRSRRAWVDESGVERRVSLRASREGGWDESPNAVDFDDLDATTQAYNKAVVTRVYPSLAAMFGYGIRRSSQTGS